MNSLEHNEHSIKFLQLTHLLHVLQITLAEIRPNKLIKKKKKIENRGRRTIQCSWFYRVNVNIPYIEQLQTTSNTKSYLETTLMILEIKYYGYRCYERLQISSAQSLS